MYYMFQNNVLYDNIYLAVRMGHRKLAAELMQEQQKSGFSMNSFNHLHIDVSLVHLDTSCGENIVPAKQSIRVPILGHILRSFFGSRI